MTQREHIIEIMKTWATTNKCPPEEMALGHLSAMVIYNLRKEVNTIDIFLTPAQYNRWIEAGNEETEDDQGKFIVFYDFTRLRKMTKEQQGQLVNSYEVQVLHPLHLKETFEALEKIESRDPKVRAKDHRAVQDLDVFLRRYW